MKNINKKIKILYIAVLSMVLVVIGAEPAFAVDSASLDYSKTGSVTVKLTDEDGAAVTSGTLTLYQVANIVDNEYVYTDEFSQCSVSLDDITKTSLASNISTFVDENSISGTTICVGNDGTVVFSDLKLGLYLVVQTVASEGYHTISPFVITIPYEEDGVIVYNVDASPKVGVLKKTDKTTTTTEPKLPQTGQLNWPIPILAISGIVLFGIGLILTTNRKKQYSET